MTKPKLPPAADWRNRKITDWNVATFIAFITETTAEKYGTEYQPGGKGSKAQRWSQERGMLKQAQGKYGNTVLRRFIEICWTEYRTNKPDQYPYPTWLFMYSYMDRNFNAAMSAVAQEQRRVQAEEQAQVNNEVLEDWF